MLVHFEGRQIGAYILLNEIGRGGMGRVFRATRPDSAYPLAIEVVNALNTSDNKYKSRFQREIHDVEHLNYPGMLPVLDRGQDSHLLLMGARRADLIC